MTTGLGEATRHDTFDGYAGYFVSQRSYFQNRVGVGVLQPRQQLSIGGHLDLYSGGANNPTRPSIRGTSTSNLMLSASGSGGTWLNIDGDSGGIRFYDGSGSGGEMGRFASNGRLGIGVSEGGSISTPTIGTWYNISNDFDEPSGRGEAVYQINNWQVSDASYRISIHKPGLTMVHVIIEAFYTEDPA